MQSRFVRKLVSGLLAFIMMFTMMADGLVLFAQEVQGDDLPLVGEYVETPETPEGQVTPLSEGDYTVTVFQPDGYLVPNMDMQFFARFDPEPAEAPAVTWSVENITGEATISESGVLSTIAVGTVRVSLAVEDGSGKTASLDVEIRSPEDYGSVGTGTAEDPYHIRTAADLDAVRNDLGAYYILDNGIVFSEADFAEGGAFYNEGKGWAPIGTESAPFTGTFYGNGNTIKGLKITISDAAETTHGGLFGYISSATVRNLGMVDGSISVGTTGSLKAAYAGSIAGYALNESVISDCYNTGSVAVSSYGGVAYAGGIVGMTFFNNGETETGTVISYCHNTGDVSVSTNSTAYAGGIAGYTDTMTYSVTDSYNTGDITAVTTGSSKGHAAGISGGNNRGSVFRCYNTGYIYAETESEMAQAAGITDSVGSTWSGLNGRVCSVSDCYNTGTVEAVSEANSYAAGILNFRSSGGEIVNCYNVGAVKVTGGGASYSKVADGICAHKAASAPGPITNCYSAKGAAKTATDATLVNADDMKASSTFQGFDFGSVWTMGGSADYPYPELQRMDMVESIVTSVEITAPKTSVYAGATMQLGIVGDLPVVWSVVGSSSWGSVDANGLFTAKTVPVDGSVTLRATYAENGAFTDDITIQVLKNMAGSGTAEDPYVIYTTSELHRIRDNLAAHYKLGGDITFSFSDFAEGGAFYNEGKGWEPIGTSKETPFTGSFDGAGYSIVGLRCTAGNGRYIGLFAYAQDAEIKNVTLSGGYIQGGYSTAGLVARAENCTITSCENRNVIEGGSGSAGLVANLIGGTATYLQNSGLIKGGYEVGGVVSYLYSGAVLSNSCNTGTLKTGTRSGGVVCTPTASTVSQCYNSGTIDIGDSSYVGGIAYKVYNGSSLLDCYNYGTVRAEDNIGGIACEMYSGDSIIQRCYNRGTIESETNYFTAAVIPSLGAGSSIKNCYMNSTCGATDQYATVVKGNDIWNPEKYVGLDFDNVWQIGNIYPELRNVPAADPVILVSEITVAGASSVNPGETAQYNATVLPNNAENANVEWSIVSGSECGSIDANGLFTAAAAGTVTVRATAKDHSDVYGEITVVVEVLAESISITAEKDLIYDNETLQLSIAAAPEGAAAPEVTWSIVSGKAYANIDENGLLTPIAGGIVVIEAAANDGSGLFAEFTLTIIPERGNGTEAHPYLISTKEELNAVRNDLDANYALQNDIEFTEADFAEGGAFYNNGSGWQPIGSEGTPFTGTFDGAGNAIKGLKINIKSESSYVYAGLFGYISGATVKNLGMEGGSVTASSDAEPAVIYAGAIAGFAVNNSSITNCYNTGSVTASEDDGNAHAGGIAGFNAKMNGVEGGAITGCYNTGTVTAASSSSFNAYAGGIAGIGSTITDCYNTGSVTATSSSIDAYENKKTCAGGIAGIGSTITDCYNTGAVTASSGSNAYAGGVAGSASSSTITGCYNTGSVTVSSGSIAYAGGILGNGSNITNSYNIGSVTASASSTSSEAYAGGIAGKSYGSIQDCYNLGSVNAEVPSSSVYAGGITACKYGGSIYRCYNVGDVTSTKTAGGIAASKISTVTVTNCYTLEGCASANSIGTVLTWDKMKQQSSFSGFDFTSVWTMTGNEGYPFPELQSNPVAATFSTGVSITPLSAPLRMGRAVQLHAVTTPVGAVDKDIVWSITEGEEFASLDENGVLTAIAVGTVTVRATSLYTDAYSEMQVSVSSYRGTGTAEDPFTIQNKDELNGMRFVPDAHYVLANDIEFTEADFAEGGDFYNEGFGWEPVGSYETPFTGSLDGAGYAIKGLKINIESGSDVYAGLFGCISGATVKNLGMEDCAILAIRSSSATGSTFVHAGSIAGSATGSTITDCYNTGSVTVINNSTSTNGYTYARAGGVVGYAYGSSAITNCYNTGSVTATNKSPSSLASDAYAGGIAGNTQNSTVTRCSNTGSVYALSDVTYAGGIVGFGGSVADCYNTGSVTASSSNYSPYAGGIAGYATDTVTNCYNTGSVTASSSNSSPYAGGIAGYATDTITNCYTMEGCASGTGENGTVLTAHQMADQASFAGFDFDSVWTMAGNEAYPCPELIGFDYAGACAEDIEVSASANTVKAGTKLQFAAAVSPENVAYKGVSWSISSGSECGSIDENGLFTAAAAGTVTVRASVYNRSSIYDEMTIEVLPVVVTIRGEGSVMQTKTLQLSATVTSEGVESSDVVWSIASGEECGSIDENGIFTATAVGTVTVRATAKDYTGIYGEMTIEVTPVMVSGITIEGEGSVVRTKTLQLSAAVLPENADDTGVVWSIVSGAECGSIDENGLFTANAVGYTTVRATAKDGSGIYDDKTIHITSLLLSSIEIEGEDSVVCGNQLQLSAIVDPEYADNTEVVWSIASGEECAEIDENGLLTPIAAGAVTVRATAKDGSGIFAEFTVTIISERGNGSEEYPYLISTKEELNAVRNDLGGIYVLQNDIEFTEADFAEGGAFYNGGSGWQPIGKDYANAFTGSFDGAGYAIKGLQINIESTSAVYAGLFGQAIEATIKNLGMEDCSVSAKTDSSFSMIAGSIVGHVADSAISNCYTTGSVTASSTGSVSSTAGGIAGISTRSIISNCYNTGSVSGGYVGGIAGVGNISTIMFCHNTGEINGVSYSGGIAGIADGSGITSCYNTGSVIAHGDDLARAGGIAGEAQNDSGVSNCYNIGSVISSHYAGGIAGEAFCNSINTCHNIGSVSGIEAAGIAGYAQETMIYSCYNAGSVNSNKDSGPYYAYIGGITGKVFGGTISDCYNTALISGGDYNGGIVGYIYEGAGIDNCYNVGGVGASNYSGGIAGFVSSGRVSFCYGLQGHGGNGAEGTVLTIAQMMDQTIFAGFDFDTTWTMGGDESYPYPELVGLDYAGECVANIEVTAPSNTVETGSQLQFTAAVSPENAAYKAVGWSIVSGSECGSIDYNGLFTATELGTVTVRATARDYSGVYGEMTIEVLPVMVSGITIEGEGSVVRSKTLQLSAVVTPADASNTDVVWSIVSGEECGSIDQNGLFTANAVGYATIRATAKDGSGVYDDKTIQITPLLLTGIEIEGEDSVIRGQKLQMSAVVSPENADNTDVEWSVNSHSGGGSGTIDENGLFTATATGQVYIYATAKDGSGTLASKRITILPILTETVEITGDDTVMRTETLQLSAAAYPENADNTEIEWSVIPGSGNGAIDENGLFTATAVGTVIVRATAKDGGAYSEKTVEVTPLLVESIEVESASDSVMRTKTLQLGTTALPENADDTDVVWSIVSGEECGLIDENGLFTAVANGSVTIRATAKDGSEVYGEKTLEVTPLLVDSILINGGGNGECVVRGQQLQLSAAAFPENADNTDVEWSIVHGSGTIDENGLFTATAVGAVTVRATAKDGSGVYSEFIIDVAPVLVGSINIDWDGRGFLPGETHQFTASVLPADADDTGIRWSISEGFDECADITEDGCFRAWNPGTVVVRAETLDGSVFSEITVEIFERTIVVDGGGVDELLSGKTLQLKASYNPYDSVTGGFVWSVPEEYQQYITVSSSGLVTALDVAERTTAVVKVSSTRPGTGSCEYILTILPVADSVILTLDGEKLGATGEPVETLQDIDMQKTPTMQLAAETYPADASDEVVWKSSNLAVAKVDADGLVSFVKPGVVTITATAADGSSVAASVKLDVFYADRSAKFTAKAENEPVPALGLETGYTTQMVVYGADGEAMDASLFDFSIPATQAAMASVDENGVITAGEKTGTVTVTAALAGDPLKRKATLSVKIIPVQAGSVVITPEDGVQALVEYVDANGDPTTKLEETVRYNLYFNKADIPATGYKFTIDAEVLATTGELMDAPKMKYTSTDTGIATVAVAKTGEVTVTVKAKSEGGCTITGTTQDLAKIEGYITVYVHDYAPCLENAKPTLNPQLKAGTELVLAPSHGNKILGAELRVAQVVDRVTQYLPSEILTLTGTDDSNVWVLNNEDAFGEATEIKNSTLKAQLVVTTMEGEYTLPFTITVKNVKPAVTTKQPSKFNLFYTDSKAELAVSVKNENVVDAYFATPTFENEYNDETDSLILRYAFPSNPRDGYVSGKAVAKGRLYVWLDGYNWPMEKDVTVGTVTTKPGLKLSSTAGTVYTALGQTTTVGFDVVDKKTGEALVYDYAVDLIKSTVPGALELNLDGTSLRLDAVPVNGIYKTSTATIAVQQSNWLDPINFTYKVTASTVQPKLTVPTINISGLYAQSEEQRQAAAVLTGTDLKLTIAQQTLTTTNITADAYLDVVYEEGVFTAAFKDGMDPAGLKAGTYSFIFEPTVYNSYGEEFLMNPVTVKVAVNRTAPTFKVGQLTLSSIFTAERSLASAEVIETKGTATLRGDARTLTTTSTVANQYLEVVYEDGVVTAHFKDGVDPTLMKSGTYSFSFNPLVENGTAEGCRLGAVTVKVKVTNAVPSVKLSGTMTLNSIPGTDMLPSSETGAKLVVTASKEAIVKNAAGGADQTLLLCSDRLVLENTNTKAAEIAQAAKLEVVFENGEVSARIIDNTIAAGKYNYKLPIRFVDGGEVREKGSLTVSVTVTKGVPSITVSAKGKLDLLNREGSSIVYTLSSMKNVSGTVTAAELIGADAHRFDYELDTSGAKPTVTLTLKDGETYSTSTTYKVAMRFTVSGGMNPIDTKTVSIKVTQGKTTVKASDTKFTVYQRNRYRTFTTQIVLTGPTTTDIEKVMISRSNKALVRNAISSYSVSYCENISGQSVANVTFIVRDTGMLKANATHTLILDVYPEGMASNLKPTQVKISLAVKK